MEIPRSARALGWLEALACLALLAMMLIVAADVTGRYLLARPLPGAIELVQYTMVVVVFAALPSVTLKRQHISLDIVHEHLRGGARRLQWVLVCGASAAVLGVQAWLLWRRSETMRENQDVIGYLNIPVHPAGYFMCALSLAAALLVLREAFRAPPPPKSA